MDLQSPQWMCQEESLPCPCPCFVFMCRPLLFVNRGHPFRTAVNSCNTNLLSLCAGPADAQAGPRIFVGKLNKDTTEADVRDHFTRFG